MTLTAKLSSRKELLFGGDCTDKVRRHPVFAKMPRKHRVSNGNSHVLRSASRLLKWTHSLIPQTLKASMLRSLALRSASQTNASLQVRKLLGRLLISQAGRTVMTNGVSASLFVRHRPKIPTQKGSSARTLTKSVLKPRKVKTIEKNTKKNYSKEGKGSKEENVTSPITITPFDRSPVFDQLHQSNFTAVRKLSSGINGDIFKYTWCPADMTQDVAVKKLRNNSLQVARSNVVDERSLYRKPAFSSPPLEDALTEIGVLSYLSRQPDVSQYLLKMHGVFSEQTFTCLVTEFANGGELFELAASGDVMSESIIQKYTWQLLQGVEYLHRHNIGHRDVSLENVLLKDGVAKLMDFGMAVRSHSPSGVPLRYFCVVGKDYYRSPELYVPRLAHVNVIAPSGSIPNEVKTIQANHDWCDVRLPSDVVSGQACMAEVCGYEVPPADVFAAGICLFMLAFQCPPWEEARLSNEIFRYFFTSTEKGLESLLQSWGKQPRSNEAMLLLKAMLHPDPSQRPSASACLDHAWLYDSAKVQ